MVRYLAGILLLLTPVTMVAQTATPAAPCPECLTYYHNPEGRTYLIEDVSLDSPEGLRTIRLNTAGHSQLSLVIFYTYSTATHVLVQLSCSIDETVSTPRPVEKLDTEGRNQRYLLSYDVSGCKSTRVLFGGSTDASGADVITVQAVGQKETAPVQ